MKRILTLLITLVLISFCVQSQEKNPLKISGVFFGDYFYNMSRPADSLKSYKNGEQTGDKFANGFSIRRMQLAFGYDFTDKIVGKIRIESDGSTFNSDSTFGIFVKDAFLQYNDILPGMNVLAGMISTMSTEFAEGLWGYRSIERIPIDLRKYLSTRDLGVAIRGKFDKEGNFGYGLMFGNNSGTKSEKDRNKRIYGTFTAKPIKELALGLSTDYTWNYKDENQTLFQFDGAYTQKDMFTLGVEAFYASKPKKVGNDFVDSLTINGLCFAVYANIIILPELAFVARYDMFDPNTNSNVKYDSRNYIVAGLAYSPVKGVRIIPNVQYEMYENGKLPNGDDKIIDPAITARITFEYKFEK